MIRFVLNRIMISSLWFEHDAPQARSFLSPPSTRGARGGEGSGVAGGSCKLLLSFGHRACRDTPHPRPLPTAARGRGVERACEVTARRLILPDGQIAHGRHARIARRANLPQVVAVAVFPKSQASSARPASMKRGVTADRHETWVRDAMDAGGVGARMARGRTMPTRTEKACGPGAPTLVSSS